jgi:hypothetical protein
LVEASGVFPPYLPVELTAKIVYFEYWNATWINPSAMW